ncbi:hypothetical protein BO221_45765 [Archangium sp. Cb G35]|nr:hypothetical protein BO221_45765 [Archangium sp. Cb G35]
MGLPNHSRRRKVASSDPQLETVRRAILELDPNGIRIGQVLRDTIDQLLDGVHTGRYKWDQLFKTEKTHAGTLVEINLQREFKFKDGALLDYSIKDIEADCKFSQSLYGWMIPPEAEDHLCLAVWASDEKSMWSAGLVRASKQHLSSGENRDRKRTLSQTGRGAITWLFENHPLPPNVFLRLAPEKVDHILDTTKSGQERVNRLFMQARELIISRAAVATAAQQDDFMKRVRENGGAREKLRRFGVVILGHEHRELARALKLAVPEKGEFVSVQLVRVPAESSRPAVIIEEERWAVALPGEPMMTAPKLPRAAP